MAKREIKCPDCAGWTEWQEQLYDRCKLCNALLEQHKIDKIAELKAQKDIEDEMEQARLAKQNPFLKKLGNYASTLFIGFILLITALIVLAAG
ncbi:hypothetical protein [Pedobacter africanus]|uniref:Uncharacterized protein n=1 Tax=Pedobacter africanus TaxID=151894 RepID=A0A1W2DII3_9SPHI|nr:hypothetical protein [Pedobacter africanus]SMC97234.1 hypothetical protein SAMN04488524_3858 [Pedobacter africanus]